ncbi:MAG: hypothetical protein ABL989_03630 [Gammaproteobacteria bacterium]
MAIKRFAQSRRLPCCILLGALLAGCGGGGSGKPSGVYLAKYPDSPMIFIQKYDFQSGDTVAVTAMGNTETGTYIIAADGLITITMPGGHQAHLKNGSGGCLVGISDAEMVAKGAEEGVNLDEMASYCPD